MKICYLADAGSVHTQRWIKYFVDAGHKVHLISKRPFGCNNVAGVELHLLKRFPDDPKYSHINLLLTYPQIKWMLKKIAPDIIHAHYITDYGTFAALTGFHPFVASAWGSDVLFDANRSKFARALAKFVLNSADMITCDGENSKSAMIELGIDHKKIALISHGVDTIGFNPHLKDAKLRTHMTAMELSPETQIVISTRRLEPIYDVSSLIEAAPLVLKFFPHARFVVAGDGSERTNLANLALALGISDHIAFVGTVSHEELPKYLASSDLYVSTSLSDGGIAVSTLEAMASGLAVVTTDIGDCKRWIKEGENGYLIPVKSPEMLADRIIYLLERRDLLRKFGSINRMLIEKHANYHKEMEKVERIYEDLAKRYSR